MYYKPIFILQEGHSNKCDLYRESMQRNKYFPLHRDQCH